MNFSPPYNNNGKCSLLRQPVGLASLTETLVPPTHRHPIMWHLYQFMLHVHFPDHVDVDVAPAGCPKSFLDLYVYVYTHHIIYLCLWGVYVCLPAYFLCCEAMANLRGKGQNFPLFGNQIWSR